MNTEPTKKNEKPSSNYKEPVPEDKVDQGEKAVKQPEDKDYTKDNPNFKNPAKQREREEQPVDPVKSPPSKNQ